MRSVFLSRTDTMFTCLLFSINKVVFNLDVKYKLCLTAESIHICLPKIFFMYIQTPNLIHETCSAESEIKMSHNMQTHTWAWPHLYAFTSTYTVQAMHNKSVSAVEAIESHTTSVV
jgi:hypothetical protein